MNQSPVEFHFRPDIKLDNNPLLEAWLEIRWQLVSGIVPPFRRDPIFPFALGVFYESVKNRFRYREDLEASRAPEDMLPHVVRHRFRPGEDAWPLLQLGPGVATVNFTDPYTWDDFEKTASYLREKLLNAYGEAQLEAQTMILRYRNGALLEQSEPVAFLKQNLNTSITLPAYIPGSASLMSSPVAANIVLNFELSRPRGTGILRFMTAVRGQPGADVDRKAADKMLIWQLEVESSDNHVPDLYSEDEFMRWLTCAHDVIHEWFFSLIEGPLFKKYKSEVEQ